MLKHVPSCGPKVLKIKESNKSTESSKISFMRLVAAETLRNRRRGKDMNKLQIYRTTNNFRLQKQIVQRN